MGRRKSTHQKCRVCLDWFRRDELRAGLCSECRKLPRRWR